MYYITNMTLSCFMPEHDILVHYLPATRNLVHPTFLLGLTIFLTGESLFEILTRSETRFLDPKFSLKSLDKISRETRF